MGLIIKRTIISILFNISLFLILMLGIQNSSSRSKVNLIVNETVSLPLSFIIGFSFISGSITSSLLTLNFKEEQ